MTICHLRPSVLSWGRGVRSSRGSFPLHPARGTASVNQLVERAAADGMSHLALTDTNALYGAVAFGHACRDNGIQPIVGMTITVSAPSPPLSRSDGREVGAAATAQSGQLVLLATGSAGYRSLCRLSSLIQGSPEREALAVRGLSWEEIQAHRDGLICLSGGRQGWIEHYLRAGDLAAAQIYAGRLAGAFDDQAYLSLEIRSDADRPIAGGSGRARQTAGHAHRRRAADLLSGARRCTPAEIAGCHPREPAAGWR